MTTPISTPVGTEEFVRSMMDADFIGGSQGWGVDGTLNRLTLAGVYQAQGMPQAPSAGLRVISMTVDDDGVSFTAVWNGAATLTVPGFLGTVMPGGIIATITGGDGTATMIGTLSAPLKMGQAYGLQVPGNAAESDALVPVVGHAAPIDAELPDVPIRGRRLAWAGVRRRTRR